MTKQIVLHHFLLKYDPFHTLQVNETAGGGGLHLIECALDPLGQYVQCFVLRVIILIPHIHFCSLHFVVLEFLLDYESKNHFTI